MGKSESRLSDFLAARSLGSRSANFDWMCNVGAWAAQYDSSVPLSPILAARAPVIPAHKTIRRRVAFSVPA